MYEIEITKKAEHFLKKLDKNEAKIILKKIYAIRENPFAHVKRLEGHKLWRLRIMDFRAVLDIVISGKKIIVLRIGHRKKVYDDL